MATIDEIFNAMADEAAEAGHEYLIIDPEARTITVPESERIFGVTGDELADRKYFMCPRYVGDGLDLAGMFLQVNFRNANGEEDGYLVEDVETHGEYITFSWQLWPKVCLYKGAIQFGVCADLPNTTDRKMPDWNTTMANGEVLEGLHPDVGDVEAETSDVVTQLRAETAAQTAAVEATGAAQVEVVEAAGAAATADAQAQIEAKGAATLATIPADYTTLANKTNEQANAIKGHLAGEVVQAGDVSPVEHYLGVKVQGKNLWNMAVITSADGKFTNNGDGTITVNGGEYYCRAAQTLAEICPQLRVGDTVKFSISTTAYAGIFLNVANTLVQNGYALTITEDMLASYVALYGVLDTDESFNDPHTISSIQLELGTVATEHTPYIDPTTVKLTRCGKFVFTKQEYTLAKEDAAWSSILMAKIQTGAGNYVAHCKFTQQGTDTTRVGLSVRDYDDAMDTLAHVDTRDTSGVLSAPFKVEPGKNGFQLFLYSNYTGDTLTTECAFKEIGVELGTEPSDFEAYTGEKYTPLEDGSVPGVTSLAPTMTLLTDTAGVKIECTYNRDSNAVYEELLAKIAALSGTN